MTTHGNVSLTIAVGNAAVQTLADVADILRGVADDLMTDRGTLDALDARSMPLVDWNGNRVGSVQVTGLYTVADDDAEADQ